MYQHFDWLITCQYHNCTNWLQINNNKANISSLSGDNTLSKANINTLQADNSVNKSNISTLQSGLSTANTNIGNNSSSINNISTSLNAQISKEQTDYSNF